MNVYVRRIATNHDLAKEINIDKPTLETFFDNEKEFIFLNKNDKDHTEYSIKITWKDVVEQQDPRISGDFKKLLRSDEGFSIGDVVLIYKTEKTKDEKKIYEAELIKKDNPLCISLTNLYKIGDEERHLLLNISKSNNEVHYKTWLDSATKITESGENIRYDQSEKESYIAILSQTKDGSISYFDLDDEKLVKSLYEAEEQNGTSKSLEKISALKNYYGYLMQKNYPNGCPCLNSDQIIYYGVPGSGKSHAIENKIDGIPKEQRKRVVFHPEYTNADFVGQILPSQIGDTIDYRFKAGPFTQILKSALLNPDKPYFLVIEEINRGNASAIFGDIFQLLDRDEDGISKYSVDNYDINAFIRSKGDSVFTSKDSEIEKEITVNNVTFNSQSGIYLPRNLSILATMNTSDQNVFVLDNAFQRRWNMKLIKNEFDDSVESKKQALANIEGFSGLQWKSFMERINSEISLKGKSSGISSMEDKRLGCWFIKPDILLGNTISAELFSEKVLKYLWDDAFRFSRKDVFKNDYESFEDLAKAFKQGKNVFNDESLLKP